MRPKAVVPVLGLISGLLTLALPAHADVPTYLPYDVNSVMSRAESVAVTDVNGDGRDDIVATTSYAGDARYDFRVVVIRQSPWGLDAPTWHHTYGRQGDTMALDTGDINNDGFGDVAVAMSAGVLVRYGSANGLEGGMYVTTNPSHELEIADLDGTGSKEIVTTGPSGIHVLRAPAPGAGWAWSTESIEHNFVMTALEVGDVNGDGALDIVGFSGRTIYTYYGFGPGFLAPGWYDAPVDPSWTAGGLAIGDIDADGRTDVAVSFPGSGSGGQVHIFRQTQPWDLGPPSVYPAAGGAAPLDMADLDGDGRLELAMAHNGAGRAGVWWSEGPTTLHEIPQAPQYRPAALALGDVNSDGVGDLVVADPNLGVVVLRADVDVDPPETVLVGGPAGTITESAATFTFTGDEPGSTFQCSLDDGPFTACASPQSYTGLADQTHQFWVRAVDLAGNTDATPAGRMFTVDTRPPETTITDGPSGTIPSNTATFSFTSNEADSTFECSLNSAPFALCPPSHTYWNLSDGTHQFRVRATDRVGHVDPSPATRTFTVARPSDLAVSLSASPDPARTKGELTYTVLVSNLGPGDSGTATVVHTLPAETALVTATSPRGSCAVGPGLPVKVTCSMGALPAGDATTVTVVVKVNAKRGAVITGQAQVSGPKVDQNPANNSATVSTPVR